jgi:hypothetical protein
MGHTYGTWLPGSPQSFRTRHHRQHIEGDYRNPPPKGKYDALHAHAKKLMKRDPVILTIEQRILIVRLMVESLERRNFEVPVASVTDIHFHILTRFRDHNPRHWIGIARKNLPTTQRNPTSEQKAACGPSAPNPSPRKIAATRSTPPSTSSIISMKAARSGTRIKFSRPILTLLEKGDILGEWKAGYDELAHDSTKGNDHLGDYAARTRGSMFSLIRRKANRGFSCGRFARGRTAFFDVRSQACVVAIATGPRACRSDISHHRVGEGHGYR